MCFCTKCACVGSMRIRRVLCGPCRRAWLTPFKKNVSELVSVLIPKEDGSLKPIIEHVNFSRLWEEQLPSFARSSIALKQASCAVAVARTQQPVRGPMQLVSLGADVQQDLIQAHSGVCTEANLRALHQQAVQQER